MSKRAQYLLLAIVVPVFILLGMCVTPLYTLYKGEEITLQTRPVDPSDVFRGDYITLQYEAEEVPLKMVDQDVITKLKNGRSGLKVFVSLVKKNGVDTPVKVSFHRPTSGIYLKGTVNYYGPPTVELGQTYTKSPENDVAYIQYSLDKYFVPDNTGTKWEQAAAKGDVLATAKVHNGYAILTGIKTK